MEPNKRINMRVKLLHLKSGAQAEPSKANSFISGSLFLEFSLTYLPGIDLYMMETSPYVDALTRLQWLFHTLDHHNYALAVAIHLRDLATLPEKHPDIYAAFCNGKFTIKKTSRPFSRMALNEGHEQNNACVKGDGGAIGLTENPAALLRWMVAGPELARIVWELLSLLDKKEADSHQYHHEDTPATQIKFLNHRVTHFVILAGISLFLIRGR